MPTYVPAQCVILLNQSLDADVKSAIPPNVPHIVVWNKVTNCIQYVNTNNGEIIVEMCAVSPIASCVTGTYSENTDSQFGTNENTPIVFSTTFNIVVDPGKWRVNFTANATGASDPGPSQRAILELRYNVNLFLTSPDVTDTTFASVEQRALPLGQTSDWKICGEFTTAVPVIIKCVYIGAELGPIIVTNEYSVGRKTLEATMICEAPE